MKQGDRVAERLRLQKVAIRQTQPRGIIHEHQVMKSMSSVAFLQDMFKVLTQQHQSNQIS